MEELRAENAKLKSGELSSLRKRLKKEEEADGLETAGTKWREGA